MTDLWWCETHNERGKDDSCWQVTDWPPDCQMVRLTAHHQDSRLIGLLAWDRCTDCDGEGHLLCECGGSWTGADHVCSEADTRCPSCRDGWVPRADTIPTDLTISRIEAMIPLEDTDD